MPKKLSSTKENDSFIVLLNNFQIIISKLKKKLKIKKKKKKKKRKFKGKTKKNSKKIHPQKIINIENNCKINPLIEYKLITRAAQNNNDINLDINDNIKYNYNNKYSIHFGIKNYKFWSNLPNALNDVNKLQHLFENKFNFKTKTIIDEKVTKFNVEKEILNFKDITDENDLLVITFSGHGHSITFDNSISGFIVPYFAQEKPEICQLISMKSLIIWSNWIPAKHVIFIFDCCFSGLSQMRGQYRKSIHTLSHLLDLKTRFVINAGNGNQKVHDGDGFNSPFVTAILNSDVVNDGQCSIKDLAADVVHKTSELSNYRQTPISGTLPGDQGGCAFLAI